MNDVGRWEENIDLHHKHTKKRPVRKAENLTTIQGHCHLIWEP